LGLTRASLGLGLSWSGLGGYADGIVMA